MSMLGLKLNHVNKRAIGVQSGPILQNTVKPLYNTVILLQNTHITVTS